MSGDNFNNRTNYSLLYRNRTGTKLIELKKKKTLYKNRFRTALIKLK